MCRHFAEFPPIVPQSERELTIRGKPSRPSERLLIAPTPKTWLPSDFWAVRGVLPCCDKEANHCVHKLYEHALRVGRHEVAHSGGVGEGHWKTTKTLCCIYYLWRHGYAIGGYFIVERFLKTKKNEK